jgi:hypothetical protein
VEVEDFVFGSSDPKINPHILTFSDLQIAGRRPFLSV